MEQKDLGKTSMGMQANLASLLCYIPMIGWIIAIVFYFAEKENKFVRFNAMQAILLVVAVFLIAIILGFIPLLGFIVMVLLGPAYLILLIILMVKAYKGEQFKLPFIGDIAEKNA